MKAKDYLQQVEKLDKIIRNKLIEKEQWKSMAISTSTSSEGERVQTSGSKHKMEDAVIRYLEIEAEIDACIDRFVDKKQEIIHTIEQLPPVEYDLLHKVYIQYMTLYDVSAAYGDKSYSWTTTVHGRALKHIQDILNAR